MYSKTQQKLTRHPIPISTRLTSETKRAITNIPSSTSKLNKRISYLPRTNSILTLHEYTRKSICDNAIKIRNIKCRKTVSLQDLSPARVQNANFARRLHVNEMRNEQDRKTWKRGNMVVAITNERTRFLATKVYLAFLRNALKKISKRSVQQAAFISTLNSQVKNSKMQIATLKSLLRSDEQFIKDWIKEVYSYRKRVEQLSKEKEDLRSVKKRLENNFEELREEYSLVKVQLLNEKNSLEQALKEATSFETQLEKERDKIKKLRSELENANDKNVSLEKDLQTKSTDMVSVSSTVKKLKDELSTNLKQLKEKKEMISNNKKKLCEEEENTTVLQAELEITRMTNLSLYKEKKYLLKELDDRKNKFASLEKLSKEQTIQMIEMQTLLMTLEAETWTSKLYFLASKFIQIPLVLLESISY